MADLNVRRQAMLHKFKHFYCRFPVLFTAVIFLFLGAFLNFCAVVLVVAGNGGTENAVMKFFVYVAYWPSLLVGIGVQSIFYPDLFMPIFINLTGWVLISFILTPFHRFICKRAV